MFCETFSKVSFNDVPGGINITGHYTENSFKSGNVIVIILVKDVIGSVLANLIKRELRKVAEIAMEDGVEFQYPIYTDEYDGMQLPNHEYFILQHNSPRSWFRGKEFRYTKRIHTTYLTITYQNKEVCFNIRHVPPVNDWFEQLDTDQFLYDIDEYLGSNNVFKGTILSNYSMLDDAYHDVVINSNNTNNSDNTNTNNYANCHGFIIHKTIVRNVTIGDNVKIYQTNNGLVLAITLENNLLEKNLSIL